MGKEENSVFTRKMIASRLKKMRKFLKLTREDVAAHLGITKEQYKNIEMGKEELLAEQLDTLEATSMHVIFQREYIRRIIL